MLVALSVASVEWGGLALDVDPLSMTEASDRFVPAAREAFSFLEGHGFESGPEQVQETPTLTEVTWVGRHVALTALFDVRDAYVALIVASVVDGHVTGRAESGYRMDLPRHLAQRGFRGSLSSGRSDPAAYRKLSDTERMRADLDSYAQALQRHAGHLLRDAEDSLAAQPASPGGGA